MQQLPRVSVVTPSYNQAPFLEETILSVLGQNYPNLEYVIVDGGSTDGTVDVIRKYESSLAYWVSEPDRGQSHALNKGIARAKGDILFWLNADDLCLPGAFLTVVEAFSQQPPPRIVIGQAYIVDGEGKTCGELVSRFTCWDDYATRRCTIRQVATFFDRNLFDELGGIDESLRYAMDVDLLLRFTRQYRPLITDRYLGAYRQYGDTKTSSNLVQSYEEADTVRMRHLAATGLGKVYRSWSSRRWIYLAMSPGKSNLERLRCARNAWRIASSGSCRHLLSVPKRILGRPPRKKSHS